MFDQLHARRTSFRVTGLLVQHAVEQPLVVALRAAGAQYFLHVRGQGFIVLQGLHRRGDGRIGFFLRDECREVVKTMGVEQPQAREMTVPAQLFRCGGEQQDTLGIRRQRFYALIGHARLRDRP